MKRIALFASGSGSNVQRIAEYFKDSPDIKITAVYCNNPSAYVLERAKNLGIPAIVFDRAEWRSGLVLEKLVAAQTDFIVLAGFLWLVPEDMVKAFPKRIINIHPALLPSYGGKGMYGSFVHEAVVANGDKESGITIHLVNEEYDKGKHLFQARTPIEEGDTAQHLAEKIHRLEHEHFPRVIEEYINSVD